MIVKFLNLGATYRFSRISLPASRQSSSLAERKAKGNRVGFQAATRNGHDASELSTALWKEGVACCAAMVPLARRKSRLRTMLPLFFTNAATQTLGFS
jgi:hypothetical protein